MNAPRPDPITLAFLRDEIADRTRLRDSDPEASHAHIDELCEAVVRACADGLPDAQEMAREVVTLLDLEAEQDWIRWYA